MSKSSFGKGMQISRKEGSPDRRFYLFPETNYAFHRVLHEIWGDYGFRPTDGSKRTIIVPSIFSKHTRKFHWFGVARWDVSPDALEGNKVDPNNILDAIRAEKTHWDAFCGNVQRCQLSGILKKSQKSVDYISGYINTTNKIPENEWITAFRHMLSLYREYHHEPDTLSGWNCMAQS